MQRAGAGAGAERSDQYNYFLIRILKPFPTQLESNQRADVKNHNFLKVNGASSPGFLDRARRTVAVPAGGVGCCAFTRPLPRRGRPDAAAGCWEVPAFVLVEITPPNRDADIDRMAGQAG